MYVIETTRKTSEHLRARKGAGDAGRDDFVSGELTPALSSLRARSEDDAGLRLRRAGPVRQRWLQLGRPRSGLRYSPRDVRRGLLLLPRRTPVPRRLQVRAGRLL